MTQTHTFFHRSSTLLLICLLLFSAACGPEESETDSEFFRRQAEQAALEYQNHSNLDAARSALNDIKVANSSQWLIMVTETALAENENIALMNALVKLSLDLGLQSQPILAHAQTSGLLPQPESAVGAAAVQEEKDDTALVATEAEPETVQRKASENAALETVTQAEPEAASQDPVPTATPELKPLARALNAINIRGGPGVNYGVVGGAQTGDEFIVMGKSPAGDWWQILLGTGQPGWVFGQLVEALNVETVSIAQNIPEPPPTAVPVPTSPPAPAAPAPAAPAPAPVDPGNPHFTLTHRELVAKKDNGDCRGRHLLRIHVKDANGNPLNGVVLKGVYVGDEIATGIQGKGDGLIEYDLHGSGEAFRVIRDADGREATSDEAGGFTTRSLDIDKETLIAAGYCSDSADCDVFYSSYGCQGHHSWNATFTRNY